MMLNMANAQFAKSFWIQFQHYSTSHFCPAACGGGAGEVTLATFESVLYTLTIFALDLQGKTRI